MDDTLRTSFSVPPRAVLPRPLWFWNAPVSPAGIRSQIKSALEAGYSGFGIVPAHGMGVDFMSTAYLDAYADAINIAAELGGRVCLYDEFWFPSGSAGGQIARMRPDALSKRLDRHSIVINGPTRYRKPVPDGRLMAAVAMNLETYERVRLNNLIDEGWLTCHVPEGRWQIDLFTCVTDGAHGLIDYLDPDAVEAFIELTYQRYHDRFPEAFGSTIDVGFYDEPTFHWVEGGRAWTPGFNEAFKQYHGYSPDLLYPALWTDIGPETAAARCALFGFRATLFEESFVRQLNSWCSSKRITLTGHVDQEEVANPVGLCGDLMKIFRHQDIPAFDQIFTYGRARKVAKVVSSAATNWNKQLVLCECYGASAGLTVRALYREAIDLFARGMNVLVPHAIWYDPDAMSFPPDLSATDPTFGEGIKDFNTWVGRIQSLLQRGRQVCDIGILYPIDSLNELYRFDAGGIPYEGGVTGRAADLAEDYLDVGNRLTTEVHRDFVYVHPELLSSACTVGRTTSGEPVLRIGDGEAAIEIRVFVIPASTTISLANLRALKKFQDAGGIVISTTQVPFN
ncbi:MAG: hypothetical protein HKN13_05300, partial [Rhodothermales bacterium]|nr:hypothetical protein [Rhodothermales bacterium]